MSAAQTEVAVVQRHQGPLSPPADTEALLQMIAAAARDPNINVDKLERLNAIRREEIAEAARRLFDSELAVLQPKLPVIDERGQIKVGNDVRSTYATLADINEIIKPILAEHGFALMHHIDQSENRIRVTGILSCAGHREQTTIDLPHDPSGSKNVVQAIKSSVTYGQRITTILLLNITSRLEMDDDGQAAGASAAGLITDQQYATIKTLMVESGTDPAKFFEFMGVSKLEELPASKFQKAISSLNAKKQQAAKKQAPKK